MSKKELTDLIQDALRDQKHAIDWLIAAETKTKQLEKIIQEQLIEKLAYNPRD